jgi:beta-lactamase regulating signal transducer with metallopeptidase domain/Tol biopolymer transport system component
MNEVINHCVTGLNGAGRVFCDYAAAILLQSAVLVVVLLIADLLLRKRVRAVFRYCVWMLVLVKLILPPTLAFPTGIGYWLGDRLPAAFPGSDRVTPATGFDPAGRRLSPASPPARETPRVEPPTRPSESAAALAPTASGMTPVTRQGILFSLWLVGVLVFAAVLVQRLRFVKGLTAFSLPADGRFARIATECARQMGIQREIGLRVSGTMSSPALCGLFRPVVLVPARIMETLAPEGLKAIAIHELAHLKRGDVWVNTLQTVLQVIHFYNPFVWLANAMIRRTREEAVDETVLVALGGQAEDYSNTLIDIGEMALWKADLGLRLIGVAESEKILRWRIKHMLTRPIPKSARIGVLGTVVLVIAAAVLLPMAKAEKSNKDASVTAQTTSADAPGKAPVVAESNVFVDQQTGIRFTKFKTLSGPSDVVAYGARINLAPNGKFLLDEWLVIPLDGGKPFDLVPMPNVYRATLSPDGRKVVFYADGMWLIEVDPETGHPAGAAKKLREARYGYNPPVRWSSDSRKIVFLSGEAGLGGGLWTLSIENGEVSQVIDPLDFGLVSPDGKMVAWSTSQGVTRDNSLYVKPVAGGEPRKVSDGGYPVAWSANSEWLVCSPAYDGGALREIRFVRVADGREAKLKAPDCWVLQARRGGKPLFYQTSYGSGPRLPKVVSAAGGPPAELGLYSNLHSLGGKFPYYLFWPREARSILAEGKTEGGGWGFWALPLDGKDPQPLTIDTPLFQQADFRILSPDGSKLLLGVREGGPFNLWMVPVSLAQMKATGQPVKVFGGMVQSYTMGGMSWPFLYAWSPDSKRIAFSHQGDIWVVSADGRNLVQLTETPEQDLWPDWSPDGTMIAFRSGDFSPSGPVIRIVSASGGEAKVIAPVSHTVGTCAWSPMGKELTMVPRDEEAILSFPILGGDARTVLRLKEKGLEDLCRLRWSPDGRLLAFQVDNGGRNHRLCIYRPDTGSLEQCENEYGAWHWSPDSKWISFFAQPSIKVRPESILWEMDIEEAVANLAK